MDQRFRSKRSFHHCLIEIVSQNVFVRQLLLPPELGLETRKNFGQQIAVPDDMFGLQQLKPGLESFRLLQGLFR